MPEPTKAQLAARVKALEKALKRETAARQRAEQQRAESDRVRTEALEQQTATSEILRVISRSQTDVQPVFDAIVTSAIRLLGGYTSVLGLVAGDQLALAALTSTDPAGDAGLRARYPLPLHSEEAILRVIRDRAPLNIADAQADPRLTEAHKASLRVRGAQCLVAVPLLRHDEALGAIAVSRREPGGFTDEEIALLQTFADQAVIAIENARLLSELQAKNAKLTESNARVTEALEQQTATSEILRVISSSPMDAQPVFDSIAASALRLCDAKLCTVFRFDGTLIHLVAGHHVTAEGAAAYRDAYPALPGRAGGTHRAILTRRIIHIPDIREDPEYEHQALARANDFGSVLAVPMLRTGQPIGAITVGREAGRGFTDEQIELLKTFADQAVIAIENVRLFTELQTSNRELTTALETQTATADILRVISASRTDVQPVFDAIVASAVRLLGGYTGTLTQLVEDRLELVALTSTDAAGDAALRALFPRSLDVGGAHTRVVRERVPINIADAFTDARLPEPVRAYARVRGFRGQAAVPMLRHDEVVGTIVVTRREVGGFTDDEIALLATFADQAVIAIENARLLSELQDKNAALRKAHAETTEALEQQTATSEILRVISSSPTDAQPVFDTIVRSSDRLLGGLAGSLALRVGDEAHLVALTSTNPEGDAAVRRLYPQPIGHGVGHAGVIRSGRPHMTSDTELELTGPDRQFARLRGFRSRLTVPLIRDGIAIGSLGVTRATPGAFTDREIALLQTFADQAVIAIENVRLFTELQTSNRDLTTALDTQTATADILRVISGSRTDVQPVFDAIVQSAVRLLGGYSGGLTRVIGDQRVLAAYMSSDPAAAATLSSTYPRPLSAEGAHGLAIRDRVPVNIVDMHTDSRVTEAGRAAALKAGYRSVVTVPLLRQGEAIGAIGVTRREPGGFADDEINLLQTFTDQAVIAIENARLLSELQEKNASLSEALEQQTATAEILKVISGSPTDIQPVLDAVAMNAATVCGATDALIMQVEGTNMRRVAHFGPIPLVLPPVRPLTRGSNAGRTIIERRPIHLDDARDPATLQEYPDIAPLMPDAPWRTMLAVPLVREDTAIGAITIRRTEVRPFTEKQISLLQTFADQAVIAIENVRLFHELQESNRDLTTALDTQTATSDILRVISGSRTDVQPVFDAIVQSAVRLLGGYGGAIGRIVGEQVELGALTSTDPAGDTALRAVFPFSLHGGGLYPQAMRERVPINLADAQTDARNPESGRALARTRGYKSWVIVPLLRHGEAIGAMSVSRREAGGFADDEITLLQTFADQAVIAIENARLLTELQARTDDLTRSVGELRALGEIGQAIGSTLDLQTVLATIVARATGLAGADAGVIYEYDAERELFEPRAAEHLEGEIMRALVTAPVRKGQGTTGQLAEVRQPIQRTDLQSEREQTAVRNALIRAGYRALLAVPLVREDLLIGGLTVFRKTPGEFPADVVELLRTFATQSALAIQNARLFRELEIKSRELEVASQHKSEFLASMSHELRTPLNAVIGFSDVLLQGMFGETNEKQTEYLRDILASGQHLLSLINDILDLSKIEAGRMELDLADFHLPSAVDDALLLMRERAGRRGITLERQVDERLGEIRADQRKVKQVLLNLLSNAVKFTPEGGRIDVRAALANGSVEISVTDTGIGIAPEDHEAVFEEFKQVGQTEKKAEGTGLGLALCRKFVELHGGRIWVKSELGAGSTFTFSLLMTQ